MSKYPIDYPLMTTCVVNKWIDINSETETELTFEVPRMGVLTGLEIQCSKGARVIRRMRLVVNEVSTIFDIPWPLGKRQRVVIPIGSATPAGAMGVFMQNKSVDGYCRVMFCPGNYSVEFRLITQWALVGQ